MCKHAVKKLPYPWKYVPDQYKAQQMCGKAILKKLWNIKSFPDCNKKQKIYNKSVKNYPHAFIPDSYKTQINVW